MKANNWCRSNKEQIKSVSKCLKGKRKLFHRNSRDFKKRKKEKSTYVHTAKHFLIEKNDEKEQTTS